MASPSEAEVQTQIRNAVDLLNQFRLYVNTNAENFVLHEDTFVQSLETDFVNEVVSALSGFRSGLNSSILGAGALMAPLLREYGKIINAPETDIASLFRRLRQHFVDNSLAVTSRSFTLGSISAAGGNVGNGTINRLSVDKDGEPIESHMPDAYTADIVSDEHSGSAEHEEVFEFRTRETPRDALQFGDLANSGQGAVQRIACASARNSLVGNASFTSVSGSGASFAVTNWTMDTPANWTSSTATVYRGDPSDGDAPRKLIVSADDGIQQNLNVRRVQLDPNTPYYCQVAYNASAGGATAGTLTLRMGAVTATANLAVAPAGWNILRITLGANNWLQTFNQEDPLIRVSVSSLNSGGALHLDDVIFVPFTRFPSRTGLWYLPVGGATPFLLDDRFTWTHTATESILQHWFARAFGEYLPSGTGSAVTFADPS